MQQTRVEVKFFQKNKTKKKNGVALQCMCVAPTPAKADILFLTVDDLEAWFSKKDPHFG